MSLDKVEKEMRIKEARRFLIDKYYCECFNKATQDMFAKYKHWWYLLFRGKEQDKRTSDLLNIKIREELGRAIDEGETR